MFRPWTVRCMAAVQTARRRFPRLVPRRFTPQLVIVALAGGIVWGCSEAPTAPIAVESIVVSPGAVTLASGASATLTAAVLDAKGGPLVGRVVTWSSADTTVATVTGPGQVLAGPNRGGVAAVVTVSALSEGRSGSATITVTPVPAARVLLSADSLTVQPGGTSALTAVIQDASGAALSGRSVAWVSLDTAIARVSATGQVTSVTIPSYAGPDTRSTRIVATAEGVADTARIVVTPLAVARVALTPGSVSLAAGTSRALTAEAQDVAGTPLTGRPIAWSVTDAGVATVSSVGVLTASAYTGAETRLTSVVALIAGRADTADVIVTPNPVASVTVAPATVYLVEGLTRQLDLYPRDAGGTILTGRAVTWTSSAPSVATVSATGLVTAIQPGNVTITATSEGRTGSAEVTVRGNVQAVSAGYTHTMILKTDGTLWAVGQNNAGQLGDGTTIDRRTPVQVMSDVQAVSAGVGYTMIVKADGTLWATGNNAFGQLGDGTVTNRNLPVQVMSGVRSVSAGWAHTMIVKTDGGLWATGSNAVGQFGNRTNVGSALPVGVWGGVRSVSVGRFHTMIVGTLGTLWAAGSDCREQLGAVPGGCTNDASEYKLFQNGSGVQEVSSGEDYTMLVLTNGELLATGSNGSGQLGIVNPTFPTGGYIHECYGDVAGSTELVPCQPGFTRVMSGVQAVSAAMKHTMILKTDGTLWATGRNNLGQLGNGTLTDFNTPVQVMSGVQAVSAGGAHTMIVKADGTLWATGWNLFGQFGDGTGTDRSTPVRIVLPR